MTSLGEETRSEMPAYLLMKGTNEVFAASPFRFGDSGCIDVTIASVRSAVSIALS